MASPSPDRILSLDVLRGVAVMGIFSVNVVGMAMIERAYFYPPDFGFAGLGDKIMWAANFIVVDGRFRTLFSMLFGASTLLVIERAEASGRDGFTAHFARMFVLLLFGLAHYYLLWWGDILTNYALVGMVAFMFRKLPIRGLLLAAVVILSTYYAIPAVEEGPQFARWQHMQGLAATSRERAEVLARFHTPPSDQELAQAKADAGGVGAHLQATVSDPHALARPIDSAFAYGIETLGLMLLGMAGFKSGFLTGSWPRRAYAVLAAVLIPANIALHAVAVTRIVADRFDPLTYQPWERIYLPWMHPIGAIGYAALIILLIHPGGGLTQRLAAAGRAAFTNYLGSTIIGVILFFGSGFGLFGTLSRGQAWLVVPPVWAVMLVWSKWWLDRFRYGPFEWAWRSLSRWQWEPLRNRIPALP